MARKKKLYLVWQDSGSYDTYFRRLCGIFDDKEKALELKAELDKNVIDSENCWTIMPQDVYCNWPTVEFDDEEGECDYDYVSEFEGYTSEQREQQEDRWYLMYEEYGEATIEVVNMNEAL